MSDVTELPERGTCARDTRNGRAGVVRAYSEGGTLVYIRDFRGYEWPVPIESVEKLVEP